MLILGGSIDTRLGKDLQKLWKDHLWQCWSWGVDWHSTWKGCAKTLEGLALTMLILGGQSTLNLERIHKNFGRIASDNVDPGGPAFEKDVWRLWKDYVDQCWSGRGDLKSWQMEGLHQTMLICEGRVDWWWTWKVDKVYTHSFQGVCWLNPPQDQHWQR